MRKKIEIRNQWALAIYLLWENYTTGVTMKLACNDYFYKFNTRLGEVEKYRKGKLKITRLPMTAKNRFGHTCNFLRYKSNANRKYLYNLILKLNRKGLC